MNCQIFHNLSLWAPESPSESYKLKGIWLSSDLDSNKFVNFLLQIKQQSVCNFFFISKYFSLSRSGFCMITPYGIWTTRALDN